MMTFDSPRKKQWALLSLAIALVLLGGALGALVQTAFGAVNVRDITIAGEHGEMIAGKLYVPDSATPEAPAPGILAIHGANNSSEMQDAYAIELSRRGYVVLAPDQYGHGGSDGNQESGWIGPAALRYLHALPMIDPDNIGIGGHSRGGAEAYVAAATEPELYRSIVFEASGPVPYALPDPENPPTLKNALFIMSSLEEFAEPVWGEAVPANVPNGDIAMAQVGTDQPVVLDEVYGDVADGSARKMVLVAGNHPFMTFSFDAVQNAVDWYGQTLDGGKALSGQVWIWKEIGGGLALIGGVLVVFAAGGLLWGSSAFAAARQTLRPARGERFGWPWLGAAAITGIVPVVTFWPFQELGNVGLAGLAFWPQTWANGILAWAVLNGVISAALIATWYTRSRRRGLVSVRDLGLTTDGGFSWSVVGRSAVVALLAVGAAYVLLVLSDWLFKTDFRFYTLALAVIDARHWAIFLAYLLPFVAYFLVLNVGLSSQLRWTGAQLTPARQMIAFSLVLAAPLLVGFLIDYFPMLTGGAMLVNEPLKSQFVLIGYQFLVMLPLAACLAVYFYKVSGSVYTGAFTAALLIVWNITTTTTIHADDGGEWGVGAIGARIVLPLIVGIGLLVAAAVLARRGRGASELPTNVEGEEAREVRV